MDSLQQWRLIVPVWVPALDGVFWYHTLGARWYSAIGGYESEFAALAKLVSPAAEREDRNHTHVSNVDAAVLASRKS